MNLPTGDLGQPAAKNNQTRIIIGVVVALVLCCCCTVVAGVVGWACGDMLTGLATSCGF